MNCHGWWNMGLSFWTILKMTGYGTETCHASKHKILKFQASAYKVKLLLFWDWNGPRLEHCLDQGTTIAAASYTEILKSKLKTAIHCKCICCPRGVFFTVSQQASVFHSSYHWSNQITEIWSSPIPPLESQLSSFRLSHVWPLKETMHE